MRHLSGVYEMASGTPWLVDPRAVPVPGPGHSGRVLPETYFRSVFPENATVKAGSPGGRSRAGVSGRGIRIAVFRDLLRRGSGCSPGGSGDWTVSGVWTRSAGFPLGYTCAIRTRRLTLRRSPQSTVIVRHLSPRGRGVHHI